MQADGHGAELRRHPRDIVSVAFAPVFWPSLAALALAACNPLGLFESPQQLPCPQLRLLAEGEHYARFTDGVVDPNRLEIEARFLSVTSECDYDDADDPSSRMVLDITVVLGVERGPAAPPAAGVAVPFFIALVAPDRQVVERTVFNAEIEAPVAGQLFAVTEPQEIQVVFPAGAAVAPWEYELVVSFLLDQGQLEFERQRRR